MAQAAETPQGRRRSLPDWIMVWVLGPVAAWLMDAAQALSAQVPMRGVLGTASAAAEGLAASAGVYAIVFVALRALLELPRCALSLLRGATARVPPVAVAILTLLAIAWLGL